MSYSTDHNLFFELLELSDSTLYVDNDCCYIVHGEKDEYGDRESTSFDFGHIDLVYLFAEKLNINTEAV